ncbi:hypothetical protein, variant [Cryptococcus amylolentus CBS 6039]|uniref:Protein kinase domain-containing protein n=1 Tax=Cryptococcus amylolentus CBS 6039 TaxID=1295533 RepID=A0A1E3HAT1_9TREE|nr:hypothetical protein, variant [Cryptococcus amylolentus CBS 6039]ODN73433.1 hypothetical protein, variant [Cryptococcus amylolentus CBS 6039]
MSHPPTPTEPPRPLPAAASPASMSASPRGRRAPAPAALDLSPQKKKSYGDLQSPYSPSPARRAVTDPVSPVSPVHRSRPLPHPPQNAQMPLPPLSRGDLSHHSTSAYPVSPLASQSYSNQHASPVQPSAIDRRNLIGVGELSTPRLPGNAGHQRAPSMPYPSTGSPSSRPPPLPHSPSRHSKDTLDVRMSRQRSNSAAQNPPRLTDKSPARQTSREALTAPNTATPDDSLYSLAALSQFEFDSSMEASLSASLSMMNLQQQQQQQETPRSSALPPIDTGTLPPSPGSARSRIYARRQQRASLTAASPSQMPSSADSQTSTFAQRAGRDNRKTPPNPTRHSSHDLLKQFAVKDFSHLPPSPSSASINQFLKTSTSTTNMTSGTPPANASSATAYFPGRTLQRSDSQKSQKHRATPKARDPNPSIDEALRKLDGLASTSGKPKPKGKASTSASTVASRPGTPEAKIYTEPRLASKPSNGSLKDAGSPLSHWIDLSEDVPAILIPKPRVPNQRESMSSTVSTGGTPTSRDSHSLPTTATTLSSTGDFATKHGRTSAGSDLSSQSASVEVSEETEEHVPPVPPLPQLYVNRQSSMPPPPTNPAFPNPAAYMPVRDPSPPLSPTGEPVSPSSLAPSQTKMHKKWSFSSALNLKSAASPVPSVEESTTPRSPQTPWSEIHRGELLSPASGHGHDSADLGVSATPLVPQNYKSSTANKRLTPSSIPFFRRSSSSSFQNKPPSQPKSQIPETPKSKQDSKTVSGSQARKSVLGMHLPSMLRGSASKKGLAQQTNQPVTTTSEVNDKELASAPAASTGWTGRKRGKTLSISGDLPKPIPTLKHQSSTDSSFSSSRTSAKSNASDATINGSSTYDRLPSIMGSPARPLEPRYSNSPRNLPSVTPTKIPRIANRPAASPATVTSSGMNLSMPPPAFPTARKVSNTVTGSGSSDYGRHPISEFGVVEGPPSTPRQSTSGAHRNHLLAPMSAKQDTRRVIHRPSDPPPVRGEAPASAVPPSRRQLPRPPSSSTVTAMTLSASAKRASREFRGRRDSKDATDGAVSSGKTSPIKPSKSMHSQMAPPSMAPRMPSSSSTGAVGSSFRKVSLAESPSVSPIGDDDEVSADAEMEAYIKRRRERAATNKKDTLADITEFPRDVSPVEPLTQRQFITRNLARMSDLERKEVLDFDLIYYSPSPGSIRRSGGAMYNHGYDDERGDYIVVEGDHLCYRYEVGGILGKGSFGQVVQCRDHKTGRSVAVKIIRNKKRFHAQALVEVKILQQLVEWDPDNKHFMVRMTDHFSFRSHLCIVTELLSINLYELIKANQFAGFSPVLIRRFTTQMLASLQLMRSHRIVHCDLKPENILLCHPAKSGIKVIDFGSSCLETEKVYTYIQSRFYRSPEVILGMNYAMAIDMWSLGCILAELYTGVPIFPGENEHEQLACIMEVLGVPDRYIIEKASRRKNFFDATGAPRPFVNAKGRRRRPGSKTLVGVLKCDDELFVDFIAKCLTWDPDKRLKPQPAMRHPWILAGRRRYAPTPSRDEKRPSERSSRLFGSSHSSMRASVKNVGDLGTPSASYKDKEKNKLLISSPVPLAATRQPYHSSTASTSRLGQTINSSRLAHQTSARNGSFTTTSKLSID